MSRISKAILFLALLACIGVFFFMLSVFIPIPFIGSAGSLLEYYIETKFILAGFIALMIIIFFAAALFVLIMPGKRNFVVHKRDKGTLQISKKTVYSAARYSYMDNSAVSSSVVKVKMSDDPEKIKIDVALILDGTDEVLSTAETVQNAIEAAMLSSLGIAVKSISVKIIGHKDKNAKSKKISKESGSAVI